MKSINLNDEYYLNTASIVHQRQKLSDILVVINNNISTINNNINQLNNKDTQLQNDINNINTEINSIKPLKLLWNDSGVYMQPGQTATLSEPISEQKHGIVIVWQAYNGSTQQYDINYQFIPKIHPLLFSGKGVSFFLTTSSGEVIATKYLYVSDTQLVGFTNNNRGKTTVSATGINTTNKNWVLTRVYGI